MASSILSRTFSKIIIITLLVINYIQAQKANTSSCGCNINVLGPFYWNRLILVCHDHRYGFNDQRQLKHSWLFTNTSVDNGDMATNAEEHSYKVSRYNMVKLVLDTNIVGTYTCLVTGPRGDPAGNCSVYLSATPTESHYKMASVETIHECQDLSPLRFEPSATKGIVRLEHGESSLTCKVEALPGPGSENNYTFAIELGVPLYNLPQGSRTRPSARNPLTSGSLLPTTSRFSTSPSLQSNGTPSSYGIDRGCRSRQEQKTNNSITIVFHNFTEACQMVYICRAGYSHLPSYESSVFPLLRRKAKQPTIDPTSKRKVYDRFKRDSSFFQKYDDHNHDNGTNDSHEEDDDDRDDERLKKGWTKKVFNPTGVIVGVAFLMLLTAAVVAVTLVCRRRMIFRSTRFMSRRISSSKIPLFINKSYNSSEKSELEEFPRKNIRFLDHIGKGTFGTVVMAETYNIHKQKRAVFADRWTTVAVKMTLISEKSNEQLKRDFLNELALMKTIPPHTNIITLYATCTAHDPYLMILEYAQHGDLRKYLLQHRSERNYANAAYCAYGVGGTPTGNLYSPSCHLYKAANVTDNKTDNTPIKNKKYIHLSTSECDLITSRDILSFALQVCRGLAHLSLNKMVHRDVAARNVLVCEHKVVKISDFGLARKVGEEDIYERTTKGLLPIRWMSPESLFYNHFSEKSDVWSYGVLLWELITLGSTPYPGMDSSTVLDKIRKRDLLICPPHSSAVVNEVVSNCWIEDPQRRPCFASLVECLEKLLESEVEYLDLDQINDHEYSTLD